MSSLADFAVFTWAGAMLGWTAVLFAAAWVADRSLRSHVRPGFRIALYAAVFVRLAIPADWSSPLVTAAYDLVPVGPGSTSVATSATESGTMSALIAAPLPELIGRSPSADAAAIVPATIRTASSWPSWLLTTYLVGFAVLAVRLFRGYRRLAVIRRQCTPASWAVAQHAPSCRVLEHAEQGPFACGVFDKVIVLPRRMSRMLSPAALRNVLAHEAAHHHRLDPLLLTALNLACVVLWPLLPLWLARAKIRGLIEQAADDYALRGATSSERKSYARLLVDLADFGCVRTQVAALSLGGYADLRGRVLALRGGIRWPRWLQIASVGSMICGAVACAGSYDPVGDSADAQDDEDQPTVERSSDAEAEALVQQATTLHDRYERTKADADQVAAEAAYEELLARYPDHPQADELTYYRAELAWAAAANAYKREASRENAQRFEVARQRFIDAIERFPNGKFVEDSLYAQLLAQKNAVEYEAPPYKDPETTEAEPNPTYDPIPYDAETQAVVDAYDLYLERTQREDEQTIKVLFDRAKVAMDHNHFDEAEPALRRLLELDSSSVLAVQASEMLTDLLTIEWVDEDNSPAEAQAAAEALGTFASGLSSRALWLLEEAHQLHEAVPRLLAGIAWKTALAQQAAGDHLECGQTFARLATEHPKHDQIDTLWWNAAQCFEAAGEHDRARELLGTLLDQRPSSAHRREAKALLRQLAR